MLRRICYWCGTKSTGRWCTCCDADLDAQEQEAKLIQAKREGQDREIALEEAAFRHEAEAAGIEFCAYCGETDCDETCTIVLHDGHEGMWLEVDGEPVHMLADPDMSDETAEALREMVQAARRMMDQEGSDDE